MAICWYVVPNVEKMLHDLRKPQLLVDLDFPGAAAPFLMPEQKYQLGPVEEGAKMAPRHHYRGLIFIDDSPALEFYQ